MEEEVVARIVDNNGEVTDEFREGDSYEKHTKEEKERKRKRDEEYRNCPKFLPDERFVKFYNNEELLFSIAEILTLGEYRFMTFLSLHVCYKDCVLRKRGITNGKILNDHDLSELLKTPYNTVRLYMKKFIDYGIVAKVLVGCREDPGHKITCYVVNPYIFTRGNRVNLEVLSYFKETKW